MKIIRQFVAILLCISLCMSLTLAQPAPDSRQETQTANTPTQDVLIIIQQEQVRFTAQKDVAEMRLQIFDQAGQLVHDSGAVTGPELTWVLRRVSGEAVKSGIYAYTLSVKEAGAELARERRGHFIVDRAKGRDRETDRLWVTIQNDGGVGTELTVAMNEGGAIAGTSVTNGQNGMTTERSAARNDESELKSGGAAAAVAAAANWTTGRIAKFVSATDLGDSIITEIGGNIGIGVGATAPAAKLHIANGDLLAGATGQEWIFHTRSHAGSDFLHITDSDNGAFQFQRGLTLTQSGSVGIGNTNPQAKLHIVSGDVLAGAPGQEWIFHTRSHRGSDFLHITDSEHGVFQWQRGLVLSQSGNVGIGTTAPQAKLDVVGQTRTQSLQITGGADFAENFDVNVATMGSDAMTTKVEAGMVVSLDPTSPGKLQLSAQAYDRRVAGIISGAGGVKPGMVMSQESTLADGKYPVALSGRVYCWVDASHGAIESGDLLTTSSTLGHAMKAMDLAKAQGAIIGKAMTGLKDGKGLVLVLVNLQ